MQLILVIRTLQAPLPAAALLANGNQDWRNIIRPNRVAAAPEKV